MQETKIVVGGIANLKEIEAFYNALEEIERKEFDNYIVAYVDFLGIKQKMKNESSYETLQILKFLLWGTKQTANYISEVNEIEGFDIKIFSDNIVIAQRVDEKKICDQIVSLVNLVAAIQFHALLQFDFWLRGGITIGELYIDNSVVWGKGLIEAYSMEDGLAIYPRVVVSPKLLSAYEKCEKKSLNLYAMLDEDNDGLWFVNFFLAAPNLNLIPDIAKFLKENVTKYINENEKVKQKINWMITYFNSYCKKYRNRGDFEQYILPCI